MASRATRCNDLVGVVEVAYSFEDDDVAWCNRLAQAASTALKSEFGALVWIYDLDPDSSIEIVGYGGHGIGESLRQTVLRLPGLASPQDRLVFATGNPVVSLSEIVKGRPADRFPPWPSVTFGEAGIEDILGIFALNPRVSAVVLMATRQLVSLTPADRSVYAMLATHIAAGLRLRFAMPRDLLSLAPVTGTDATQCDAILEPDGRVVHLHEHVRRPGRVEALRDAAKAVDRARGRLRRSDATEALSIWRGLAAGHYSLVDHFDTDGRRYVIAKRNEPGVVDPRRLTRRERQVVYYGALGYSNKLIGYTLGLSTSTVGSHLARAMRKLGARRKLELATMVMDGPDVDPH